MAKRPRPARPKVNQIHPADMRDVVRDTRHVYGSAQTSVIGTVPGQPKGRARPTPPEADPHRPARTTVSSADCYYKSPSPTGVRPSRSRRGDGVAEVVALPGRTSQAFKRLIDAFAADPSLGQARLCVPAAELENARRLLAAAAAQGLLRSEDRERVEIVPIAEPSDVVIPPESPAAPAPACGPAPAPAAEADPAPAGPAPAPAAEAGPAPAGPAAPLEEDDLAAAPADLTEEPFDEESDGV